MIPSLPSPGYSTAEGLDVNIRPMSPSYLHQDILQIFPAKKVSDVPSTHELSYLQPGYSPAEGLDVNIRPMSLSYLHQDYYS
eukprot:gene13763-19667_t